MSLILISTLAVIMVVTSFLSGLFGMAGGMVLMGVLLAIMPVPEAMALHGVTQMASNGWRALVWWRFIRFDAAAYYLVGGAIAMIGWGLIAYVPDKPIAMLMLGLTPVAVRLLPENVKPNPERFKDGVVYGAICVTLILLTGVVGPLLDTYFLGGKLDRREMVATKAFCQTAGHTAKLFYFTAVASAADVNTTMMIVAILASMLGTSISRRFLESMTDKQFRQWSWMFVTAVSVFYVSSGLYLLAAPMLKGA